MFELAPSRCAARSLALRRCLAAACLGWLALPAMALEFTTTFAPPTGDVRHTFTLDQDSAVSLYSTLSGGATCGNTGFGILSADGQSDVVSSNHFAACSPDEVRGPWALKAGTYQFRMWHNASGGTYMAQLVTASPTRGNDSEPNDTPSSAQSLVLGQPVFGHLGYRDAAGTDSEDHYRFSVAQQGALSWDLTADASLPAGARFVTLYAADGATPVHDLTALAAGSYVLKVSADTYYAGAYGGYTLGTTFTPAAGPVNPPSAGGIESSNLGLNARYVLLQTVFTPSQTDVAAGGDVKLYFAAHYMGQFYFFVRVDDYDFTLVPYTGGEPAAYTTASVQDLATRTWMLGLFDVSALVPPGFDLYAGFGRSVEDMLSQGQVRLAHRVN